MRQHELWRVCMTHCNGAFKAFFDTVLRSRSFAKVACHGQCHDPLHGPDRNRQEESKTKSKIYIIMNAMVERSSENCFAYSP
jgi:hypothetical protein